MLVVANGAFKSGSTWQTSVARHLSRPAKIPEKFQQPGWINDSIDPNRLAEFLASQDLDETTYVSKNHIRDPKLRSLLLGDQRVRVLTITRDLRDVLVSAFHHDQRESDSGDIHSYFESLGRKRLKDVLAHHRLWNTGHERVFVSSYERMQQNPGAEVTALGGFLGVWPSEQTVARIVANTSFNHLQTKEANDFFRRGEAGAWRSELPESLYQKVNDLALS